jgi:hypothetical protein
MQAQVFQTVSITATAMRLGALALTCRARAPQRLRVLAHILHRAGTLMNLTIALSIAPAVVIGRADSYAREAQTLAAKDYIAKFVRTKVRPQPDWHAPTHQQG